VHFEPCEGGEREKEEKMRREGKEEFLKRCRVRPRLGYRRWSGGGALSPSPFDVAETKRSSRFYPAVWLSGCPSVCPSVCPTRLVSQQAGTARIRDSGFGSGTVSWGLPFSFVWLVCLIAGLTISVPAKLTLTDHLHTCMGKGK